MLFGISPGTSSMAKFWHMNVIKYGSFMVIVKPCKNQSFFKVALLSLTEVARHT